MKTFFPGLVVLVVLSSVGLTAGIDLFAVLNGCPTVSPTATCPDSQITFYLYTRANPTTAQVIVNNNLSFTNFVPYKPTKMIIHGLNGSSNADPLMVKEFLIKGDYNVISVDWYPLSKMGTALCLPYGITNAVHVGTCVGSLIAALRQTGNNNLHIIGHSMGAYVAAVAARYVLPIKVNRITGLDPAFWILNTAPADNLSPDIANFVDLVVTCFNDLVTYGHAYFYMNKVCEQPGCAQTDPNISSGECGHLRAIKYFTESINSATGFYGWQCPDISAIFGGVCIFHGGRTILMGNSASTSTRGLVQVPTNSYPPFAMGYSYFSRH